MNAVRRKVLASIVEQLDIQLSHLDSVYDDEFEAMENVPESLWKTYRYLAMEEACDTLDSVKNDLTSIIEQIREIIYV